MITHSKKNLTNNSLVVMKTRGLLVKKLTINLFTLVFTKEIPGNEKSKKFYICNFVYVDYDIEVFLYLYQRSFKLQSFCN